MAFTIAFYVHHHGSGHLMRSLEIAAALRDYQVILMGSGLAGVSLENRENIELIHLPMDTASENEVQLNPNQLPDTFHYAPIGISGISRRMAMMAMLFVREAPLILVVDVSVEIALFARLCAVPTVVIRQHGERHDLPHLMAYQSASILIAPFSREMYIGERDWAFEKTLFTGGFSRFSNGKEIGPGNHNQIAILIGTGGSSINTSLIETIALKSPGFFFKVIGASSGNSAAANIQWCGRVPNPRELLESCAIIIGNTGHNTVMEVASLNRRFIGIPEERPFHEQLQKAQSIANRKGIRIISVSELEELDWQLVLVDLSGETVDWQGVITLNALSIFTRAILDAGHSHYGA